HRGVCPEAGILAYQQLQEFGGTLFGSEFRQCIGGSPADPSVAVLKKRNDLGRCSDVLQISQGPDRALAGLSIVQEFNDLGNCFPRSEAPERLRSRRANGRLGVL